MQQTKAAQTQATKERLERVARELFGQHGFAGLGMEEVVAKAGVTRGALYHHYESKEGLFEAVVDGVMQDVHARLAAASAKQADPLDALEHGIGVYLKICADPKVQRILLVDAPAVLGWPRWRELDAKYGFGLVKQALARAAKAGLLRQHDVDVLAHVLLGALTEAAMAVARSPHPAQMRKEVERALASVLAAWRQPRSS